MKRLNKKKAFSQKTKGKMKVQLGISSLTRLFYQVVLPFSIKILGGYHDKQGELSTKYSAGIKAIQAMAVV